MNSREIDVAREVADRVSHGVVLLDPARTIVHANLAAAQLLGHAPDSIRGLPVDAVLVFTDRPLELMLTKAAEAGAVLDYPHSAVRLGDGRHLVINVSISTLELDRRPHLMLSLCALPLAETNREQQWRLFSLATTNLLWNWNLADNRVERSVGFETAFGYSPEDIDEAISWWIDRIDDADRDRVLRIFADTLDAGETHCTYEYRFRRRDGSYADIRDSVYIMRDASGVAVRALGAMTDISAQKALEHERARADRLTGVGLLAAGVAHDFNNLLMGLRLTTDVLRDLLEPGTKAAQLTSDVIRASEAMAALATRMLTFSRGGHPELCAVDICALVREHAELTTSGSSVKLKLDLPSEPLETMADPAQIGQVISNVVLNATQALTADGGQLEVSVRPRAAPPGHEGPEWIEIQIADDGPGIDAESMAQIFDLYYSTRGNGRGVGLAVASSIVHRHGGTLEARSVPGQGAQFTIRLPLRPVERQPERAEPAPRRRARDGSVLVLDDDDTVRLAIREALESFGLCVTEAHEGREAIRVYTEAIEAAQPFDVALLDLTLRGGHDGAAVARQLHAISPVTPLILMSGYSEHEAMAKFRDHGFTARLRKPFSLDTLESALDLAWPANRASAS